MNKFIKRNAHIVFAFLAALMLLAVSVSGLIVKAQGANWLTGYDYRKPITITGSVDGALTNHQMPFYVHKDYPPIATNGLSLPLQANCYPASCYYNGKTYVAWQTLDPYIDCYDHATGTWYGAIKIGTNPLAGDNHGAPSIIVDNSGYIHVFWGCHNMPVKYAISTNPEDISVWSAQPDIGATCSYPQPVKDGAGVIWLFVRELIGGVYEEYYRKSTDWTTSYKIIEVEAAGDFIYSSVSEDDNNGRIHIAWAHYDTTTGIWENIFHAYLNTSDEHMYDMAGSDLGTTISYAEAESNCKIVAETTYNCGWYRRIHLDANKYPHIEYYKIVGPQTNPYHISWNGSSWDNTAITTVGAPEDFIINATDDIDSYIKTSGLQHYHWDGTSWSFVTEIIDGTDLKEGTSVYAQLVRDGQSTLRLVCCDHSGADYATELEVFAIDSSGSFLDHIDHVGCHGNCLDDFADVRFTGADGTTELDYWIESYNSGDDAIVWVEFDSIAASPDTTNFYIYYKDDDAVTTSNPCTTFIAFDDFEWGNDGDAISDSGGCPTWYKVVAGASLAEISTAQKYQGTRSFRLYRDGANSPYAQLPLTASPNVSISFRIRKEDTADLRCMHSDGATGVYIRCYTDEGIDYYTGASYEDAGGSVVADTWALFELNNFDWVGQTVDIWLNGIKIIDDADVSYAQTIPANTYRFSSLAGTSSVWIDNVLGRSWTPNDPTFTAWGVAEPRLPSLLTLSASNVTYRGAKLNGNLSDVGGEGNVNIWFEYGLDTSYGNVAGNQSVAATGNYSFDLAVGDLDRSFHYRFVGQDGAITYGADENFILPYASDVYPGLSGFALILPLVVFACFLCGVISTGFIGFNMQKQDNVKGAVTMWVISLLLFTIGTIGFNVVVGAINTILMGTPGR